MKDKLLDYNLQFFAGGEETGTGQATDEGAGTGEGETGQGQSSEGTTSNVNYDEIQKMLEETLRAAEDTTLKAYFRQQGLNQEEIESTINTLKQQKANTELDFDTMKNDLLTAQNLQKKTELKLQEEKVKNKATMAAFSLGIDVKTIPYVLKMSDFSSVVGSGGKILDEEITKAINKVLEDIPILKSVKSNETGFRKIGSSQTDDEKNVNDKLDRIFGIKK